jgi:hypothetical protein
MLASGEPASQVAKGKPYTVRRRATHGCGSSLDKNKGMLKLPGRRRSEAEFRIASVEPRRARKGDRNRDCFLPD